MVHNCTGTGFEQLNTENKTSFQKNFSIFKWEERLFHFQMKKQKNFKACIEINFVSTFKIQINADFKLPLNFNIPIFVDY